MSDEWKTTGKDFMKSQSFDLREERGEYLVVKD